MAAVTLKYIGNGGSTVYTRTYSLITRPKGVDRPEHTSPAKRYDDKSCSGVLLQKKKGFYREITLELMPSTNVDDIIFANEFVNSDVMSIVYAGEEIPVIWADEEHEGYWAAEFEAVVGFTLQLREKTPMSTWTASTVRVNIVDFYHTPIIEIGEENDIANPVTLETGVGDLLLDDTGLAFPEFDFDENSIIVESAGRYQREEIIADMSTLEVTVGGHLKWNIYRTGSGGPSAGNTYKAKFKISLQAI